MAICRISALLTALIMSLAIVPGAFAQGPPALFESASPNARASERAQRTAHQARMARLRLEALDLPSVRLNLFDNADRIAYRTAFERVGGDKALWHGRTDDGGTVALAVVSGMVSGAVFLDGRTFEITPYTDGDHVITELNPAAFPTEDAPIDGLDLAGDEGVSAVASASSATADGSSQMDVMVLWTPAARHAVGGTTAGIESVVLAAIANANLAYSNSGVSARLNLVYSGEVSFSEGSIQSDLSTLTTSGDGVLDSVHTLRQQHGADVVTLLGSGYTAAGSCGIGYIMQSASTAFAPYAFNIVDQSCAVGNLTYAHEVGHNQGLQHDPGNAAAAPSYAYAYGYQDPGNVFRTVMSYGGAPRIAHFSSPATSFNGRPTGTTDQDNARALRNNAAVVAGFKSSSSSTPSCSYSVSPTALSFSAASGTATVTVTTTSGCTWNSTSGASWAAVSGSGTGSGTATVTVSVNGTSSRSAVVTIAGKSVTVSQAADVVSCSYSVTPTSLAFGAAAGSAVVSVSTSAGCSWTTSSGSSWAAVTGGKTGAGSVTVSVVTNSGGSRTANVTVAGRSVTVTQAAAAASACSYTVTPTSMSFTSAGGTATVAVTTGAGCSWTTAGSTQWLKVAGSGSGSGSATINVSSTNGGGRSGSVTVAGKTVSVSQAGAPKGGKKW
jgi:hypothetical protein